MLKTRHVFMNLLLLSTLLLGACRSSDRVTPNIYKGNIAISGAFALYPLMVRWTQEYQALHPGIVFDLSTGGAGKGMTDTLAGAVDIGMVSRAINPQEVSQGAYSVAVARDAVFPVVNAANPALEQLLKTGLTRETLEQVFISGEVTRWSQVVDLPNSEAAIHVYTRADACGAAETWALFLGDYKQEDLLGIGVSGDPGVLDAVVKDPLGIGYNNLNYVFDMNTGLPAKGAVVLPVDVNHNGKADPWELLQTRQDALQAVADGLYPSPPARLLYLVTDGKPGGRVQAFLQWALSAGQDYVSVSGYVPLTTLQLAESFDLVK